MAAETMNLAIPTLYFSRPDLKPGTAEWNSMRDRVREALEEYGCFGASFDKFSPELAQGILDVTEEICALPVEIKKRNTFDRPHCGYINSDVTAARLLHSLCIDESSSPDMVEAFTKKLWPEGNPTVSKTILSFSQVLSELDQMVRRMILESFGVEKQHIDEHLQSSNILVRVNKYEAPNTDEILIGALPHTDKGIVTLLLENQVAGLQVMTKDGEWKNITFPSPTTLVVMTGDSLHAVLNGRLDPTYHRVMVSGYETRYTVGTFTVPKPGSIVKAAEELVDEEHPLEYKPFDFYKFYEFFKPASAKNPLRSSLKAYCGV